MPALSVKVIGALGVGLIYELYYGGGDTFNLYAQGAGQIWNAFIDDPIVGLRLILAGKSHSPEIFQYSSQIYTFGDLPTYFVVRVAAFLSIFTFNSYYANAILFATLSFSGIWALYKTFYQLYPNLYKAVAVIVLFIPSVFFWGSGILKDTVTLGALGWFTYSVFEVFHHRRNITVNSIILLLSGFIIFHVKIYIFLSFLPALVLWICFKQLLKIKNFVLRIIIAPIILSTAIFIGLYAVQTFGESDYKYSIDNFQKTAEVTSEWLHYVSKVQGGSVYSLGDDDFSTSGLLRKFLPAVWVTLFRPYIWESSNPMMLLSAVESMLMLLITIAVFIKSGIRGLIKTMTQHPIVIPFLLFSIIFAFAIGVSTYNFGSLVRYKIPLIPYYLFAVLVIYQNSTVRKKNTIINYGTNYNY